MIELTLLHILRFKVNYLVYFQNVLFLGELTVALPLMHLAGSKQIGDSIWDEIQYPVAHRLLEKCDAVLRLEGASKGADNDVKIALEKGLKVYYSLDEIPDLTQK